MIIISSVSACESEAMLKITAWPAFRCRNPYNRLLYEALSRYGVAISEFHPLRVLLKGSDILHLHWPDDLLNRRNWGFAACLVIGLLFYLLLLRLRGVRIVWTVHNLRSHEHFHPILERFFWRVFPRLLDGFICLSDSGRRLALKRWPLLRKKASCIAYHGHYKALCRPLLMKSKSRAELHLAGANSVILFFGQARPYKNIESLITAFRKTCERRSALIIAGRAASSRYGKHLKSLVGLDDRIHIELRFLDDKTLRTYIAAADLVALPYERPYNSGAAIMALSCNRPILVPDYPTMLELKRNAGANWVHTYHPPLSPAILNSFLNAKSTVPGVADPDLNLYDWDSIAKVTAEFYLSLLTL